MDNICLKLRQLPRAKGAIGLLGILGTVVIAGASVSPLLAQDFGGMIRKSRQTEAKTTLSNMIEVQKAFYTKNGKFATSIAQLGVRPSTQYYNYHVVPQGSNSLRVAMTAQAKPFTVSSYTSAVFALKSNHQTVFVAGTCQTTAPSLKPPAMPKPPQNPSGHIQCPPGSDLL